MRGKIIRKMINTSSMVFILFFLIKSGNANLPLTETTYTIPETEINITFSEEVIQINNYYRKENYSLGIGLLSHLSIWYSFDYLHNSTKINPSKNRLGDSYLKLWYYIDNFYNLFHCGILLSFRIPTGANAYTDTQWRSISFGKNELKLGPVFQIKLYKLFYLHLNLFYVFRQGMNEDFYGGLYLNPTKKETYSKFFGLNFKSQNTFLERNRLKNDYIIHSIGIDSDIIYPFIPFIEVYASYRIFKEYDNENDNIPIEGAGVNPVFLSSGVRYFFSDLLFGIYYILNLKQEKNFIKNIFGFDFSLQF